jgi:hypothetical protein
MPISVAEPALSIDQAVDLMNRGAEEPVKPEEPAEVASEDSTRTNAADDSPVSKELAEEPVEDSGDTPEDNATNEDAGAEAPRTPPSHWNAEERASFAKAPPELQDAILAQEGKREAVLKRHKDDALEARRAAEAERGEVEKRVAFLDHILPAAAQTFQTRWAGIDWSRLPDEVGADQAFKLKAQFDGEREQMGRLLAERERAQTEQHRHFVATETEKLKTEAPDLADPKEGRARAAALGSFLTGEGFPATRISLMSAKEAAIAYDAMRWRQAQAKAKVQPQSTRTPGPRNVVKPTAAPAPRSSTTRADDAMKRLARTGRIDDAVAYLNARIS